MERSWATNTEEQQEQRIYKKKSRSEAKRARKGQSEGGSKVLLKRLVTTETAPTPLPALQHTQVLALHHYLWANHCKYFSYFHLFWVFSGWRLLGTAHLSPVFSLKWFSPPAASTTSVSKDVHYVLLLLSLLKNVKKKNVIFQNGEMSSDRRLNSSIGERIINDHMTVPDLKLIGSRVAECQIFVIIVA